MKKYVLTVSEKFPKGHIRAGEVWNGLLPAAAQWRLDSANHHPAKRC